MAALHTDIGEACRQFYQYVNLQNGFSVLRHITGKLTHQGLTNSMKQLIEMHSNKFPTFSQERKALT